MPKRWEQELDRLNTLNAPASVRGRIESGPHGDGPDRSPNRRQRVIAGVVALALFAVALAFAARAFREPTATSAAAPSPHAVVLTFASENGPEATLQFEGASIAGNGSSYNWTEGGGTAIADTFGSELQFPSWIVLPAGSPIQIDGSAERVKGWVDRPVDDYEQPPHLYELPDAGARVPQDAGRYVLEFSASWPQGSRTFYFPIKAIEGTDVGASLTLGADPDPTASLAYEGAVAPMERGPYCWGNGQSPSCTDGDAQPFNSNQYLDIPVGTALNVYPSQEPVSYSLALSTDDDPTAQSGPGADVRRFDAPGSYILMVTAKWEQGDVRFFFPVRVVVDQGSAGPTPIGSTGADPSPSEPVTTISPTPNGDSTTAIPDVVGLGDQAAISQLIQAGFDVEPLFRDVPGDAWKVVSSDPVPGTLVDPGSTVTLTIVSRVTPLPDAATDALDCDAGAFVAFGSPHMVVTPAGSAFIMNTSGIKRSDAVVSMDPSGEGLWHVIRQGSVIAVVDHRTLDGVACAGSGVAGA
jgi:hypothetical protein